MDNKVVILGTAHGINTPGKCSPDKKFREYKFSREVINILKPKLESLGLTVYIDIPQDEVRRPAGSELAKLTFNSVETIPNPNASVAFFSSCSNS